MCLSPAGGAIHESQQHSLYIQQDGWIGRRLQRIRSWTCPVHVQLFEQAVVVCSCAACTTSSRLCVCLLCVSFVVGCSLYLPRQAAVAAGGICQGPVTKCQLPSANCQAPQSKQGLALITLPCSGAHSLLASLLHSVCCSQLSRFHLKCITLAKHLRGIVLLILSLMFHADDIISYLL